MFRDFGKWGFFAGRAWQYQNGYEFLIYWDRNSDPQEGERIWQKELGFWVSFCWPMWGWIRHQGASGELWKVGIEWNWLPAIGVACGRHRWLISGKRRCVMFDWFYPHLHKIRRV